MRSCWTIPDADRTASRSSKRLGAPGLASGEPESDSRNLASRGAQLNPQIDLDQPMETGDGRDLISVDCPGLLRQIEPQQWFNPMDMDWDLWDWIMAASGTTP